MWSNQRLLLDKGIQDISIAFLFLNKMTKGSEDYNKRGIVQSTRARFVGTKSSWSVKKESYVKISKDCESRSGDGKATKLIASSRFTDKRARRKRGKASAIPRTFPCKESPWEGEREKKKTWRIEKGFQDSDKSVRKVWMNAILVVLDAPVLFRR